MDISISAAITKINEMMNGLIAALPNVVIGIIIFIAFLFGSVDLLTDRRMSFPLKADSVRECYVNQLSSPRKKGRFKSQKARSARMRRRRRIT